MNAAIAVMSAPNNATFIDHNCQSLTELTRRLAFQSTRFFLSWRSFDGRCEVGQVSLSHRQRQLVRTRQTHLRLGLFLANYTQSQLHRRTH